MVWLRWPVPGVSHLFLSCFREISHLFLNYFSLLSYFPIYFPLISHFFPSSQIFLDNFSVVSRFSVTISQLFLVSQLSFLNCFSLINYARAHYFERGSRICK